MNRRTFLTSLLALPFVPAMLRAAKPKAMTQTFNKNLSISVDMDCSLGCWTEARSDGTGSVKFIVHDAKPSNDCSWSCHEQDGTHVSFIAPSDIGPAEIKDRIRLAM